MKTLGFICISLFALLSLSTTVLGQSRDLKRAYEQSRKQYQIYEDLRTIRGKVEIVNHPSLGRTEARNEYILFQRVGCTKCVMSIQADGEGKYSLTVSKGKYRVIKRGPKASNDFSKVYDFLSPLQKRIVDVSGKENPIIFNIEILLPTD